MNRRTEADMKDEWTQKTKDEEAHIAREYI